MNLTNLNAPRMTTEDRIRGFAEIELQLNDGTRKAVRVHALSPIDFANAAHLSDREAMLDVLVQVLRESPEFVREQVSPAGQLQITQTLAALVCSEGEAAALIDAAAQKAMAATTTPKEIEQMSEAIQAPVVTEADVRAETKSFPVRTRAGGEKIITVRALSWRTYLRVSYSLGNGDVVGAVSAALADQAAPLCEDKFLNDLVVSQLPMIATVAMQLANGVDEARAHLRARLFQPADAPTDEAAS